MQEREVVWLRSLLVGDGLSGNQWERKVSITLWKWCTYEKHMLVLVLLIEVKHLLRECCSFCSQKRFFTFHMPYFNLEVSVCTISRWKMDSLDFVLYRAWIVSKESVVYIFSQWTAVTKLFHEYFPCLVKYINFLVFFSFLFFCSV